MSELLVNTIKKADGTGSLSVPAESGTVVTTASPSLGRRNLIINGAMQVAQRGTSATNKNVTGYYTVDRWIIAKNSGPTFDFEQSTDAPTDFTKSFKTTVNTSDTLGATDYSFLRYPFEGQDVSHLNWGTANAKTVTVSFWVKSSIAGTHGFLLGKQGQAMYGVQYTISSANTWEYVTTTIQGPTFGTFATDTSRGFELVFDLGVGSTYSQTAGSWVGTNTFGVTGAVKLSETTGATFQITGVQLEVGTVATPFEHRSFGEELALCQRYYEAGHARQYGSSDGTLNIVHEETFKVQKRTTPTMTNTSWTYARSGASGSVSVVNYGTTKDKHGRYGNIGATWVVGYFAGDWVADAEL